MDTNAGTVTARYLAPGGAHVTITATGSYRPVEADDIYVIVIDCEACGPVWSDSSIIENHLQGRAEQVADKHATTCRRIPERLWPEAGAR
jgi:hypothetical protein